MGTRTNLVLGVALLVIGLVGMALTAAATQSIPSTSPGGGILRLPSDMDAMFIEQMIPHHDDAIEMARLAATQAEHPELRRLAGEIERAQSAENDLMRELYREWYGVGVPTDSARGMGMMGRMMSDPADMRRLAQSDPFDEAFIELMVPHHRMGIMMAQMAGGATRRPEIRELTDSIIRSQTAEIELMVGWYRDWYGR